MADVREPQAGMLEFDDGAMCYAPDLVADPTPALFDPSNPMLAARPVGEGGRQAAWFVSGAFGDAVLRHYRRGGLIARLSRDRYVWTGAGHTRSFAEFALLDRMHRQGLPVPRPVAAAYWRHGLSYRCAILVARLPGVRTLAGVLEAFSPEAVAHAILSMHEAGVWHADLNAFNILIDGAGKAWLIDFDRGRAGPCVAQAQREANLLRLRRSLVKVAGGQGVESWVRIRDEYFRQLAQI